MDMFIFILFLLGFLTLQALFVNYVFSKPKYLHKHYDDIVLFWMFCPVLGFMVGFVIFIQDWSKNETK